MTFWVDMSFINDILEQFCHFNDILGPFSHLLNDIFPYVLSFTK